MGFNETMCTQMGSGLGWAKGSSSLTPDLSKHALAYCAWCRAWHGMSYQEQQPPRGLQGPKGCEPARLQPHLPPSLQSGHAAFL